MPNIGYVDVGPISSATVSSAITSAAATALAPAATAPRPTTSAPIAPATESGFGPVFSGQSDVWTQLAVGRPDFGTFLGGAGIQMGDAATSAAVSRSLLNGKMLRQLRSGGVTRFARGYGQRIRRSGVIRWR